MTNRTVLFIFAMALASFAFGEVVIYSMTRATATGRVTVAADASRRNCVKSVDVTTDTAAVFRVLDGGTTVYAVDLAANGGLVRDWDFDSAMCNAAANTVLEMYLSAGTHKISYTTFTY